MAISGAFDHWPRLGMGCARVGSFNNPATLRESRDLLEAAMQAGMTLFDTADIYGQGDSERTVGRAVAGHAPPPLIVTKGGRRFSAKARMLLPLKPLLRPLLSRRGQGNAVTALRGQAEQCEWSATYLSTTLPASLRRLRREQIEAFLLHSPPAQVIDHPATVEVMASFLQAGMARHVGVSCDDVESLEATLRVPIYTVVQLEWPVIEAIRNGPLAAALKERGLAVIARGVLASQPGRDPLDAYAAALDDPLINTMLVGTQQPERLQAIVRRFATTITQGRS